MNIIPKVSILMPSLNVREYIQECIESVINQTLKEIEIICIDAGSTDGTLEILQEYANRDSRITILNSIKKSYGLQMNMGIDHAKGEYIGIVETDDYIRSDMYENLYELAKSDQLDFLKSDFCRFVYDLNELLDWEKEHYKISSDGAYIRYEKLVDDNEIYTRILNPQEDISLFKAPLNIWSGLYNLDFLKVNEIRFNETPGASFQDNGFYFQTFAWASRIRFVEKAYYMNRRDNPNSSVKDRTKVYCMNEEYDFIYAFLKKHPILEEKLIPIYCYKKYVNFEFTYNRIEQKFKLGYIARFNEVFLEHLENGDLKKELFENHRWNKLMKIIHNPLEIYFYTFDFNKLSIEKQNDVTSNLKQQIECLKVNNNHIKSELAQIRNSKSYKIGKAITYVPRKMYRCCCCFIDHGCVYTVKNMIKRINHIFKQR